MSELAEQIRRLRDEALEARARGAFGRARDALVRLEQIDPHDPQWPKLLAECHDRLGDGERRLEALSRAAMAYAERGFAVRAIAVCKMILAAAHDHGPAHEILAKMQGVRRTGLDRFRRRRPATLRPGAAIEEVPLRDAIDGAIVEKPGVYEIPIEVVPPDDGSSPFEVVASSSLFAMLPPDALREVVAAATLIDAAEGEVIYRRGDAAETMYVVVDGALALATDEAAAPGLPVIARLGPGDVAGVIGMCGEIDRPFTARATEPTRMLALHRDAISPLLRVAPELLEALLVVARERLLARLVATHPWFVDLTPVDRQQLLGRFRFLEVMAGVTLVEQGSLLDGMYVALTGGLERRGEDPRVAAEPLDDGAVIGDRELASGTAAVTSIVARRNSFVLALPRAELVELWARNPSLVEHVWHTDGVDRRVAVP